MSGLGGSEEEEEWSVPVGSEEERWSVRYEHSLASDTTNSDPAGHAEVTTGHHHRRYLHRDDVEDNHDHDEMRSKKNSE